MTSRCLVKLSGVGSVPTPDLLAPSGVRRIPVGVPAVIDQPSPVSRALLPKLSEQLEFRVDEGTKQRLEGLLLARAKRGLRLSLGDLGREALLRYLETEEKSLGGAQ